jgi:CelD/BcsL family acetyltransferase involved in cellulose biosynthesis
VVQRYGHTVGYLRDAQRAVSYQVTTAGSFDAYRSSLSASSRRRLFGARARLINDHGPVTLEYADAAMLDEYFDQLNSLHALRWGSPVFTGAKLAFNREIAAWLLDEGLLRFSRLIVAGAVRSVLLDLRFGREEINLQSGYDPEFDSRIPLGYVHLGYAIEACFADSIDSFDLLAGWGKNSNYKRAIATDQRQLAVNHLVRSSWAMAGYWLRDRVRR